jgi:tyrosyl-tRNA synthetase
MTLGKISARDDFAKRIAAEKPVYLHECLYPLMQGWDSVEIRADVELGGTEQLFSLLVARDLQAEQGQSPQVAMTMPILVGTDGVRRMGKSLGNYIGVAEKADDQFGKVMSLPDEPMRQYFTLLTDLPIAEVDRLLGPGINPRDAKEVLGKAIVAQYHGPEAAEEAAESFRRRTRKVDPNPEAMIAAFISRKDLDAEGQLPAYRLVVKAGLRGSSNQARQLIQGKGFTYGPDRKIPSDPTELIRVEDGMVVRAGTRMIAQVHLKD